MKRIGMIIGIIFLTLLIVVGCSMGEMSNTPTKQAEIFFKKYQTLDQSVLNDLNRVVALETQFNNDQREMYKEIMKKHYQNLTYKIKDEEIDGDFAVVTIEIEVNDYANELRNSEIYLAEHPDEFQNELGEYDVGKYSDYRLDRLKDAEEKVKYTLELNLTKVDKKWQVDQISSIDEEKIHGIYVY
ncbi:MAG: hypothetical protein PHW32_02175 [Bacilli bacterium]|nr:hypothetical protein [Bacilli bacterium]MDD4718786.1 hypothetical protein [Bacilli bacterium]